MMNAKEKREFRKKIQYGVIDFLIGNVNSDEDFFLALLYTQEKITNSLMLFDDIYEREK